jgi:hypothetical protein
VPICSTCKKVLNDEDVYFINPPISISEWDFKNNHKRDEEYICCGRFRMVGQVTGEQHDYEIPSGVEFNK